MTPPVVGPDGALSAELRERLEEIAGSGFSYCLPVPSAREIVDAIVAELRAAGWRHLPSVMADDEASAGTA